MFRPEITFITGRPNFALMSRIARHGFLAVQLQEVRTQRLDAVLQRRVIGVDRHRDLVRPPFDTRAEFAGDAEAQVPRRRRERT